MTAPETVRSTDRAGRRRARAVIAAVIAFGVVLRLVFAFGYWVGKPLTLDEQEYLLLATSLARGDGLRYPASNVERTARHFERPPVFAVFLAGVLRLTGDPLARAPVDATGMPQGFPRSSTDVPVSIKVIQSLIGGLVMLLIAAIAARLAGAAGGVVAAVLAAVYVPLASSGGYVLAEPLYSVLAMGVVLLLHRGAHEPRSTGPDAADAGAIRTAWPVLTAGVLSGIGVLTKEAMLFFLPLAAIWLLRRRGLTAAVLLALGAALVVSPWIARNYSIYGRFVLTAPHGGVTFWTGNNPLATGEGDLAANPDMGRARVAFERSHPAASTEAIDNEYYRDAFRFITGRPLAWAALLGRKVFYTFAPIGPSYRLHSRLYFLATLGSYGLLLPFAVLEVVGTLRSRRAGRLTALWLLVLSTVIVCVVFFPQERFRMPVIDPVVVICAGAWFSSLGRVNRLFLRSPDLPGLV